MISLLLFAEQTTENSVEVSWVDTWSFIVSCISTFMTILLTILIIIQTNNNTKKNSELSERIAKSEETFNKLQLKLQQREDKKQAYRTICKCIQYSCTLNEMLSKFCNMNNADIVHCNDELRKTYKIDIVEISNDLQLAQLFISPENRWLIKDFGVNFTKLLSAIAIFEKQNNCVKVNIDELQSVQQQLVLLIGRAKSVLEKLEKELLL